MISPKEWKSSFAFFKWETSKGGTGQINIGLGKGTALDIFNKNILGFREVK
jgi:hypothetical protein